MIVIAQLGGYLNRKCDGPLGFECLWRGYVLFDARVQIMQLHQSFLNGEWRIHPQRRNRS
jgi:hypothetical protein